MKTAHFFPTVLMTTFLCGTMIAPAFASDPVAPTQPSAPAAAPTAPATPTADPADTSASTADDSTTASTTDTPAVSTSPSHRYTFVYGTVLGEVYVRLKDAQKEDDAKIIIEVMSATGGLSRIQRAKIIADRLQQLCDADPSFVSHLQPGHVDTQVVVSSPEDPTIVTADPNSRRAAGAPSCDVYAQWIIENIDNKLKGISFRDATFDYQLTGDQKQQRAYEYYKEGIEAYSEGTQSAVDPDEKKCAITVAESKLATAIALAPGYEYCRLQLAKMYAEQGDKTKAHGYFHSVYTASGVDPDDKKDALAGDQRLGLSAS